MNEAQKTKCRLAILRTSVYNAITRFSVGATAEQVYDFLSKAWTHRKVEMSRADVAAAVQWCIEQEHIIEMNGGLFKHVHPYILSVDYKTCEAKPRRAA